MMPILLTVKHISVDRHVELALPHGNPTHEREQGSLRYITVCCRFPSVDLAWAAQRDQISISSRAKGAAIVGKCTRRP